MGQQAAGEQCGVGLAHVHGVVHLHVQIEGLADVIEQHEEDYQSAQGVDGLEPSGSRY